MEELKFVVCLFGGASIVLCLIFMSIFNKTEKTELTPENLQKRHRLLLLFFALLFLLIGAMASAIAFISGDYKMAWPVLAVVLSALLMVFFSFLKK